MVNTAKLVAISLLILISNFAVAGTDSVTLENARSEFAKGHFGKAIELYSQIPAGSDFWLDALEEKAWSYTRQGQYENALAELHSITSTVWSSQVGPETYMLSTFVSLKICAYKDVVKKINLFKKRMLPRVAALETLIAKPLTEDFVALSEKLKTEKVTMMSLGQQAEKYPRYFFRDQILLSEIKLGNSAKISERLQQLAKEDLQEISLNLKKMKVIDVELIQKMILTDVKNKKQDNELKFPKIDRDQQLIFPVTDEEVWIDEVGHFQVKTDLCEKRKSL